MKSIGWGVVWIASSRDNSPCEPKLIRGHSSKVTAKRLATSYGRRHGFDHVELFIKEPGE